MSYLPLDKLRQEIAPEIGRDKFCEIVRALQLKGFPKPDPMFKGHYYLPAVRRWLDVRNGLAESDHVSVPNGKEKWP